MDTQSISFASYSVLLVFGELLLLRNKFRYEFEPNKAPRFSRLAKQSMAVTFLDFRLASWRYWIDVNTIGNLIAKVVAILGFKSSRGVLLPTHIEESHRES